MCLCFSYHGILLVRSAVYRSYMFFFIHVQIFSFLLCISLSLSFDRHHEIMSTSSKLTIKLRMNLTRQCKIFILEIKWKSSSRKYVYLERKESSLLQLDCVTMEEKYNLTYKYKDQIKKCENKTLSPCARSNDGRCLYI